VALFIPIIEGISLLRNFRQKNNAAGGVPITAAAIPLRENGFNRNIYENREDIRNKRATNSHSDIISEFSYVYRLFSYWIF